MKKFAKIFLSMLCAVVLALPVFVLAACGGGKGGDEHVDYVSQLKLDFTSDTKKQEVKVRMYIDGDTTHFDPISADDPISVKLPGCNNPASDFAGTQGYIKARYLAIDTPESTGDIEKWGKTASNFTHDKLANAKSIIVESDVNEWKIDSTGERYTLWVWYLPNDETDPLAYRNLNVEILQNGFAWASSTANNRYGEIAQAALNQAIAEKLHVYSPSYTVDENYYSGDAITVDLQRLRFNIAQYNQKKVRVEGVVTAVFNHYAYIEDAFEDEDGNVSYHGMVIFYGYKVGAIENVLTVGNRVNVVGNITQFSGNYQLSGVSASTTRPTANDSTVVSKGHAAAFTPTSAYDLIYGKASAKFETKNEDGEEVYETITIDYGEAAANTTVSLSNLTVQSVSVTSNGGDSDGAMSLRCVAEDGTQITIRTEVLMDNGVQVTPDRFPTGTKINVKGLVEKYTPDYQNNPNTYYYQVKVHRIDYITIL